MSRLPVPGRHLAAVLVLSALAGCATVGPDYVPPELALPPLFEEPPPPGAGDSAALARWWAAFDDPQLAGLIERGLAGSLELQLAESRLVEARALLRQSEAARQPFLGFGASGAARAEQRLESGGDGRISGSANTGLDASWEADLFGGRERSIEAATAGVGAALERRRAVEVALTAEIGVNYIALRSAQQRRVIALELLRSQEETLALVEQRAGVGLATGLDVARSRSAVESLRAQIPGIEAEIQGARNRLAVLLGTPPGTLAQELAATRRVPVVRAGPGPGVPADLLRRRPDLRAAERDLARATAAIGVASAALYPRLTLPGSLTLVVAGLGTGALVETLVGTLAASLSLPLADGGQRVAAVEAAEARALQALLDYRLSLLQALEDVERALFEHAETRARHAALRRAVEADQRAYALALQLYQEGVTSFLDLLDAQRSLNGSRQALVVAEAALSSRLVTLYRALGGGWDDGAV